MSPSLQPPPSGIARPGFESVPISPCASGVTIDSFHEVWAAHHQGLLDASLQELTTKAVHLPSVLPEYQTSLNRIVLYAPRDSSVHFFSEFLPGLLPKLPADTRIDIIARTVSDERTYQWWPLPNDQRVHLHEAATGFEGPGIFGRDYVLGGEKRLLIPHHYCAGGSGHTDGGIALSDILHSALGSDPLLLPLIIDGGDVVMARDRRGELVALVGSDSFVSSSRYYHQLDRTLNTGEFKRIVALAMGADRTIILGQKDVRQQFIKQPEALFHADLAILPIGDGKLGLLAVKGGGGAAGRIIRDQLSAYRELLSDFNVELMPHTVEQVVAFETIFGSVLYQHQNKSGALIPDYLISAVPECVDILKDMGFDLHTVPDCESLAYKKSTLRCVLGRG